MAAVSIQRTLPLALAVAACLVGHTSAATAENIERHLFRIPGTHHLVVLGATQPLNATSSKSLLAAIAAWLSREFGLPEIDGYPEVELVSSSAISALRYKSLLPPAAHNVAQAPGSAEPQTSAEQRTNETIAIYVDPEKTIYLNKGWTGQTPAELSVLVHEMVHHFQNKLGLKHECPQEREKLAYAAQDRWLNLFGHSLETEFGLDGFSVLGKTQCFY